jgi:hypothetical protein
MAARFAARLASLDVVGRRHPATSNWPATAKARHRRLAREGTAAACSLALLLISARKREEIERGERRKGRRTKR